MAMNLRPVASEAPRKAPLFSLGEVVSICLFLITALGLYANQVKTDENQVVRIGSLEARLRESIELRLKMETKLDDIILKFATFEAQHRAQEKKIDEMKRGP